MHSCACRTPVAGCRSPVCVRLAAGCLVLPSCLLLVPTAPVCRSCGHLSFGASLQYGPLPRAIFCWGWQRANPDAAIPRLSRHGAGFLKPPCFLSLLILSCLPWANALRLRRLSPGGQDSATVTRFLSCVHSRPGCGGCRCVCVHQSLVVPLCVVLRTATNCWNGDFHCRAADSAASSPAGRSCGGRSIVGIAVCATVFVARLQLLFRSALHSWSACLCVVKVPAELP